MIKKNKIPTILGIVVLLIGVFAGVFLLKNNQIFRTGAEGGIPTNVRVSNVTDTSITVSWTTREATSGFVSYGTSEKVGVVISEAEDKKFLTHSVTITKLNPETNYFFKINSNGVMFDNNNIPWQFTTGKSLPINQLIIPISGTVITASGEPLKRAIVYVTVNGYLISTLTSESGNFVLQLGSVRTPDFSSYAQIDPEGTLLEVFVESEKGENAVARIFPKSANPIPALIVGQNQDFRNLETLFDNKNPDADINLPEENQSSEKSGFNVDTSTPDTVEKEVILENITEGETVSDSVPEFYGRGPAGSKITITIHSDTEVEGVVLVNQNSYWNWSPPINLSQGPHTITISWVDSLGITRILTRNFVVKAEGYQTPNPTPTNTPKTSLLPTSVSAPAGTDENLPDSGSLTPTLLLSMMGVVVLASSIYIWKLAKG